MHRGDVSRVFAVKSKNMSTAGLEPAISWCVTNPSLSYWVVVVRRDAISPGGLEIFRQLMRISCATESVVAENTGNGHWHASSKSESRIEHTLPCNSPQCPSKSFSLSTFYYFWQVLKLSTRLILALSLAGPSKQSILLSVPCLARPGCHTQPRQVEAKRHLQALNRPCKRLKGL